MRIRIKIKVTFIQGWESIWIFLFDYLPCNSIKCNFIALGSSNSSRYAATRSTDLVKFAMRRWRTVAASTVSVQQSLKRNDRARSDNRVRKLVPSLWCTNSEKLFTLLTVLHGFQNILRHTLKSPKTKFSIEFNIGNPKKHLSYQNYLKFLAVFNSVELFLPL